jgi:transcriptional regulator with XRE-family HTH domain
MSPKAATLRAQWLGKLLHDLRESASLTPKDAAEHIYRAASTIHRIEAGTFPARLPDVLELLNLYGVTDQGLRRGIEDLTRDIWRKGWWDEYSDAVPTKIIDLAWLESRAESFRDFSALVLHGLLQTPDYARAVLRAADMDYTDHDLDLWTEFRMRRHDIFQRDNPPEYTSVLDEGALRRQVGGPKVMRAQLAHLLDLADRPNFTLRVLPFTAGAPASPEGAFTYLTMPQPFSDVVQINTEGGAHYLERPTTDRFAEAYTRLEGETLDADDSRAYIKTLMEQLS